MEEQKEVTKLDRVKDHVARHKVIYCVAGGAVVMGVGVLVGAKIGVRSAPVNSLVAGQDIVTGTKIVDASTTNIISMGGRMRKIVQNMETGEIFASVTDAAEAAGVNRVIMSKHLNGHLDSINGTLFRIIGLSTEQFA